MDVRDWLAAKREARLREGCAQIAELVRAGELSEEAANEWRVELEDRLLGGDS